MAASPGASSRRSVTYGDDEDFDDEIDDDAETDGRTQIRSDVRPSARVELFQ